MATVTMPQLGESVTEGTIIQWLKQPGDPVALDDPLCEIETEKVTAELPSPFEGTMGEIFVPQGETVPVGAALCAVVEAGASGTPAAVGAADAGAIATDTCPADVTPSAGRWSGGPMAIPPEERELPKVGANGHGEQRAGGTAASVARSSATSRASHQPDNRARFYSPAVMRLAREHTIDLAHIHGTGVGGRVTRKDVESFVASGAPTSIAEPAPADAAIAEVAAHAHAAAPATLTPTGEFETVELSATRKKIAENLRRSNLEAPQAWTMVEADVSGMVALRSREKERFQREEGVELTLLPYFTAAVCETLREFPMLNARWEGEELRQYRDLNISVAVATEHGLVTPVVHQAGDLSVQGLAKRIGDLVQRAHIRKLRVEDIEGGTFTVNNTGSFGSIASKPIVNYPQVAIVTMERAVKRPVVRDDDSIAVRWMMNVCLSFDHRAMDGLQAGNFLAALKARIEGMG
ncbi:MAG: 2-oxo acid dehydrogenase subunit E2 [Dehalococcoidia bacterium]|nr:2-oxo acid dehydrogenase subunit E2 [Dehalococcoidia bacterium]